MDAPTTEGHRPTPQSGKSTRVRPRWIWRTLVLTVPLHVLAFFLLYFGGVQLVETEILRAHSKDSEVLLAQAVDNLHLTMRDGPEADVHRRLREFAARHRELNLHIFDAAGEAITGQTLAEGERAEVDDFLAGPRKHRFWLVRGERLTQMRGMLRIVADQRCVPCHEVGELRGTASMTRDLTRQVESVRQRLRDWVILGVGIWIFVAGVINRTMVHAGSRSAARVRAHLEEGKEEPQPALILDPVSAALFESLSQKLRDQRAREEHLAERMHHADRLASLGQLAAGLAHEIKNPLAGIQGALEILRDEPLDVPTSEVYQQMLDELKRVDATIRTLLRFGRPSPPHRAETPVAGLLEDTVQLLRPGLLRHSVSLELQVASGLGSFPLDPEQIRQVLVNLISNAAEAIREDPEKTGGRIVVRASAFPREDGIILAVEDDGPGISEEDQKKIFQPFYSTKFTGTGLGLAVVDSFVTRHGGDIEVKSEPGWGTTFFVMLPDPAEPAAGEDDERGEI